MLAMVGETIIAYHIHFEQQSYLVILIQTHRALKPCDILFCIIELTLLLNHTLFVHHMTSYHLSPIIVDKNVNLAYAWVNLWLSVSNLFVWKTGECIVVGSSSIWTKIREHICVIRVFCVFSTTKAWRNNYSENWTAWQGLGCDWALLATASIYDQNSTHNKAQNPCTFFLSQTKAGGGLNKCEQLFFFCPETAPISSHEGHSWWLPHSAI